MKNKSAYELDVVGFVSEVMLDHGHAHYGYFPDGLPKVLSLQALAQAQIDYLEKVIEVLPENVNRILDVGSGTGANANALIERGFEVSCVSPSDQMNNMARAKLPKGTQVYDAYFEALDISETFDLCFFAESFHYLDLEKALDQAARYAKRGIVIFDYFRRPGAKHENESHSYHQEFLKAVDSQGVFKVSIDHDMTDAIEPTFMIFEHIRNDKIAPFIHRLRTKFCQDHPVRCWFMERFLGRYLNKVCKPSSGSRFLRKNEYRLIVMVPQS